MMTATPPAAPPRVTITLNGQRRDVPAHATVLEAINAAGIPLPQLCKDPDRPPLGACRTCLVQIEGVRGFPASCSTPVRDGMVVQTNTPEVERIRRGVLDLTLGMLPAAAEGVDGRLGELGRAAQQHGLARSTYTPPASRPIDDSKSFFVLDRDRCILCARCTTACDRVQQIGAIALNGKGHETRVGVFGDGLMADSNCTSCGQCVATCPTGAIRPKAPVRPVAREVHTTCPYCGVGCGIVLQVTKDGRFNPMSDDEPANPSSQGMLCVKGRFGFNYVHHRDRLTTPLVLRHGKLEPASWDEALDLVAEQFARYRGRFAALASAKATNEDGYVAQKFVRAIMGTNNIDHCTRLCHSPSVEAMLASVGSGATSNSYQDYEEAGCLMVVGADATANHPVAAVRFRRAVNEHGAKLIVVNPKWVELCNYADLWISHRPGTDVALFNGLAYIILTENLADWEFIRTRCENFEPWRDTVMQYPPERVAEITGVAPEALFYAARTFARPPHGGSCLIWGMGVTQHTNGTANAFALLNLALVTGQLGKPASGISPLRGQNNVQGCGDAGCIPTNLPGYQRYDPETLAKFERAWGRPLPNQVGMTVTDMVEAAGRGELQAMYIIGENPLLGEPDLHHAAEALAQLQFLVVQDIFLQETAQIAHVVLPATTFAEKDGTFTNSERRVQRVRRAIAPLGDSRPDWQITQEIARRTAAKLGFEARGFDYQHPSEIFAEMASLTPILAGISYERLEAGGIQWPCPTPDHPGTPYLYADSFPRGKGRFFPVEQGARAAELPDPDYPFILNTGRVLYHWHGGTLTRRVQGLLDLAPDLEVAIHPRDAERLGLQSGDPIRVWSRRGELFGVARVTAAVRPGETFVPFVKLQESAANFLTNAQFDPDSKIPEYKVCAVNVEKLREPTRLR